MTDAAVPAKTATPVLHRFYPRMRLYEELDRAGRCPVTWISGPPGSGKTTLVGAYLESRKHTSLWYQVDRDDGNPASFFHYLGLAAKDATPCHHDPLPDLTPEYPAGLRTFARNYFCLLYARLAPSRILVLDNYQDAPADTGFHELVSIALSEIPPGRTMIVISRTDPPPTMTRLRANGHLVLIGWEALQLTEEESSGIAGLYGIELQSPEVRERVHLRARGWVAGLVLMIEQCRRGADSGERIGRFIPESIFDYFASEIFLETDEDTRQFLMRTAFLPKMKATEAAALTGRQDAEFLLGRLCRENCFIVQYARSCPVFEYHPLFREFLLERAYESISERDIVAIKRRGARVLAEGGRIEEAVSLMRQIGDWDSLVAIIRRHAETMLAQGRGSIVERWIEAVPDEYRERDPWLLYWLGNCLLPHDAEGARGRFKAALSLFKSRRERSGALLAWAGGVDTVICAWADFKPLDEWIEDIEALLGGDVPFESPDVETRVVGGVFTALLYRRPADPRLPEYAQRIRGMISGKANVLLRLTMGLHLLFYDSWWGGDPERAGMLVDLLEPLAQQSGGFPSAQIVWCTVLAVYRWMSADNEGSLKAVDEGLRLSRETGVHLWDFMLMAQGVWATLTSGDVCAARHRLKTIAAAVDGDRLLGLCHYHFQQSIVALHENAQTRMLKHAESALRLAREAGVPWAEGIVLSVVARAQFANGRHTMATRLLRQTREIGRTIGSKTVEYGAVLAQAEKSCESGPPRRCEASLRTLFQLSRKQGFVNSPWWRGAAMSRLCAKALDYGIEEEFVRGLIGKRGLLPPSLLSAPEQWPWPVRIYTMGRFALVVNGESVGEHGVIGRPLLLLKCLVAMGGRDVAPAGIVDALWPDSEGDTGRQVFDTTLHRLRKLLRGKRALVLQEGRLGIDRRYVWLDVWVLERRLGDLERSLQHPTDGRAGADIERLTARIFASYHGPFLDGEDGAWAMPCRERLHLRVVTLVESLGRRWGALGDWEQAIVGYQRGTVIDPRVESFYQHLMIAYCANGQPAEAIATYDRCREALRSLLRVAPSAATERILERLRSPERLSSSRRSRVKGFKGSGAG